MLHTSYKRKGSLQTCLQNIACAHKDLVSKCSLLLHKKRSFEQDISPSNPVSLTKSNKIKSSTANQSVILVWLVGKQLDFALRTKGKERQSVDKRDGESPFFLTAFAFSCRLFSTSQNFSFEYKLG